MAENTKIEWCDHTFNPWIGCTKVSPACDNCYAACPETAIVKLGPSHGFRVNTELCTGCAVCVEQCPCHAMEMVPEDAPDPANAREASR